MSKQMNYEEAMTRLETIVQQMEQGELDIDSLAKQLTEAKKLIALCEAKLTAANDKIDKLLAG